uniref:Photosystem I reaction center subunit IX n=1 Tax=Chloropicon sieburthii TaxID=1764286 RepID=A0A4D6C2H9_9CHLO|nr:subunit IX of photosystem I [Chloropicon sieburthii]QBX97627.1 subunit IX of photosystem I [Chloropicon sieburthii]
MKNFTTYLSSAPVVLLLTASFLSGLLIEINRFFPDPLIYYPS